MTDPNSESSESVSLEAEVLAKALDALKRGDSISADAKSPELEMAARMAGAFSKEEPVLRREFDEQTEAMLLSRFARTAEEWEKADTIEVDEMLRGDEQIRGQHHEKRESLADTVSRAWRLWWRTISIPAIATVAVAAVLFLVVAPLVNPSSTLSEVQGFESLSEAERLLGQLPEDAMTEDGIDVGALREQIHEVNVILAQTDTTLDPTAEAFPHVELRDSALEIIELEEELNEDLEDRYLAFVPTSDVMAFNEKVSGWPTTNEGVSYAVHAKAVRTFVTHGQALNADLLAIAEQIVEEVED